MRKALSYKKGVKNVDEMDTLAVKVHEYFCDPWLTNRHLLSTFSYSIDHICFPLNRSKQAVIVDTDDGKSNLHSFLQHSTN